VPNVSRLSIALVGPPTVEVDGRPLEVDTRKATALLAYLAVTGRGVSRDALAGLLWPNTAPDRARSALRRTLSTLRAALGDRWLVTERDIVALDATGVALDLARIRELVDEVGAHEHQGRPACAGCHAKLMGAVDLARGAFMEGFGLRDSAAFDDWQQLVADDVSREVAALLDLVADDLSARGDHPQALAVARRRLSLQPLHEPAHRQLIRLLAASGDRSAALEQYRECVRALDRELGVHPLAETTELYHAILDGTLESWSVVPDRPPVETAGPTPERYPLVGRDTALATLTGLLDRIETDGRLAVIVGEAGIGKTRLAEELLAHARACGRTAFSARCFPHESDLAYGVIAELTRAALLVRTPDTTLGWWADDVARIVPELGRAPGSQLDSLAPQSRFYEAVSALLVETASANGPGLICVDDLQWADRSSLGLLGYLANRLRSRPLLLVLSWRDDEVDASHPVNALADAARRTRDGRLVTLDRLSRDDVETLVRSAGHETDLAPRLHRRSSGLPFFVVEYLDAVGDAAGDAGSTMPAGVRELLLARLGTVGELATQVVAAGAVIGRGFTVESVRDSSGRTDEEVVVAIEELVGRGILTEGVDGSFEFRHEQTRELVYEGMTRARRRLLHRRAADALATGARGGDQTAVVARHFELGGDELAAAELYQLAGDRARGLYANVEALGHYRSALALGSPQVADLHAAIGDLETLGGHYPSALASYEAAAAHADPDALPAIEHRIGLLYLRRGAWELADAALASAVDGLAEPEAARALADRSLVAHRRGRTDDAEALAHEALDRAMLTGDGRALAQTRNLLGMLAEARGDRRTAEAELVTSLELARDAGDAPAEVAALNNLALVAGRADDVDRSVELGREALDLCVKLGDRHREAALRNNHADMLHRAGRAEEAMAALKEAVSIFAEIGEDARREPELWKLSEW
jgi:DNA-binding SARP family transcriptional activator